jgi:ribosomal protein S18 acetylase RimI-like enzyme
LWLRSKLSAASDISALPAGPGLAATGLIRERESSHTLAEVRTGAVVTELGADGFLAGLGQLVPVYAAAMRPDPRQLPGRRATMERHASYPQFRALAVCAQPGGPVIAFAYGYRGAPGQYWHDVVVSGVTARLGAPVAAAWLDNTLDIAEVHVHPDHQGRGIGRGMLLRLTANRPERTAVLSTRDAESTARRLYRGLGFTDLLTGFGFPGDGPPYAVMGALLPLRHLPGSAPPGHWRVARSPAGEG